MLLIELDVPIHGRYNKWSPKRFEEELADKLGDGTLLVWGEINGVDSTYRKIRQLSAETERDAPQQDRIHSAHKAMSFFRDMFPQSFWAWKRIGGDHPTAEEKPMMKGR